MSVFGMYVCVWVGGSMYIYAHVCNMCMHAHICEYVCVCKHMCIYMHVCNMYMHAHICE